MAVYHVVLYKYKADVTDEQKAECKALMDAMVGQIPGLLKLDSGPPLAQTAHRALGFDGGLVAVLETPEHLPGYAEHPAHLKAHHARLPLCTETLAYDMEF